MIFGGKTTKSEPKVAPGPKLTYTHNEKHWSNEDTTVQLFQQIILPYIEATRQTKASEDEKVAVVFADSFDAHWTSKVLELVEQDPQVV